MDLRVIPLLLLGGCPSAGPEPTDRQSTDGGPTDVVDAPTGSTGDSGSSTPKPAFPALLVPDANGVVVLELDGSVRRSWTWPELAPPSCDPCGGEGASADGDGLLLSFTTVEGGVGEGSIARVGADGSADFRVDGFAFPHDVMRDPADETLIVVETFGDRVVWIPGDGSSATPVRQLGARVPGFPGAPNGAERFDDAGRSYLLLSHLGGGGIGGGLPGRGGQITLWDITTPTAELVWGYPEAADLRTPHGPILRREGGRWWLIWAHTLGGGPTRGSIGVAVTDSLRSLPTYVADLVPPEGEYGFLRGVELHEGRLTITDSVPGQITTADWPALKVPEGGETGARGDQVFVQMTHVSELASGFDNPFEGWLWQDPVGPDASGGP